MIHTDTKLRGLTSSKVITVVLYIFHRCMLLINSLLPPISVLIPWWATAYSCLSSKPPKSLGRSLDPLCQSHLCVCSSSQHLFLKLAWRTHSRAGQMGCRPPKVCLQRPVQPEVALEGSGAQAARTWATRGGLDRVGAWPWHTRLEEAWGGGAQAHDPREWKKPRWCVAGAQAQDPHGQKRPCGCVNRLNLRLKHPGGDILHGNSTSEFWIKVQD